MDASRHLSNPARPLLTADLHVVLQRSEAVLLGLRQNTGYCDGLYHLPSGRLEMNETFWAAAAREAEEELGVRLSPETTELVHVMHHRSNSDRIGLFFQSAHWIGEIENQEPEKCAGWSWHELDHLPANIVPYARAALVNIRAGNILSFYGW